MADQLNERNGEKMWKVHKSDKLQQKCWQDNDLTQEWILEEKSKG